MDDGRRPAKPLTHVDQTDMTRPKAPRNTRRLPPGQARPDIPPAVHDRRIAAGILEAILMRGQPMDEAFAARERQFPVADDESPGRTRAFVRMLVTTTLRQLGLIDAVIGRCLTDRRRGLPDLAALLLRLGTAQLLFLATPAHAAVSTTLALADARRLSGLKGLANAVLRRIDREREALLADLDPARANTPDWLWQSWAEAYGEPAAHAIAAAHLGEPPLDLTVKADPARWAERLGGQVLATGSVRVTASGPVPALAGFEAGDWWVQDAAAALPARLLGAGPGQRVYDLCAAPGGKTAQLAVTGATVTAVDRSRQRLERLTLNLARLSLTAETVAADAAAWDPGTPADAVLVDAPCSATGTIRRRPDVAWAKTPGDVAAMAHLQDRLIDQAVTLTRPGGRLVYCTCSLQREEGEDRIARLLADHAPVRIDPIQASEIGGLQAAVRADGTVRILPCHLADEGGIDGFYMARLLRL